MYYNARHGLTKREIFYYKGVDNGSEYVSKTTGLITKKEKVGVVH